jgi:L-ascorbate metabolism protein UlaG (beta-lactamase superfamily)
LRGLSPLNEDETAATLNSRQVCAIIRFGRTLESFMKDLPLDWIDWLGHASFRLRGEKTAYIDPWKLDGKPRDGDLILITHGHYDHLSMEDVRRVAKPGATVVVPESTAEDVDWAPCATVAPGQSFEAGGVRIHTVPAYNTNKKFHPRENRWVGYIVELNGLRVYHCGDTDEIPEMDSITCDIALVPVSGTYVMTAQEAASAVGRIGPGVAIPMHYGDIVGEDSDAEVFRKLANCEVDVKTPVA